MQEDKNKRGKKKSVVRSLIKWILIILFILPILTTLLFQIPSVQNYVAKKTTNYLSNKMGTQVSIDKVNISVFEGVSLQKFLLYDSERGDTVLYTQSLNLTLAKNLFSLIDNKVSIRNINLSNPHIHLVVEKNTGEINLIKYINRLSTKNENSNKKTVQLDIKDILISDGEFILFNELTNQILNSTLKEARIKINSINLKNNIYIIESLNLINPDVTITKASVKISKSKEVTKKTSPLCLTILHTNILDGKLRMKKHEEEKLSNHFDANNFLLKNINLEIRNFNFGNIDDLYADVENLEVIFGENDLILQKIKIPSLSITDEAINLNGFEIKTDESYLQRDLSLTYDEFLSFKQVISDGYLLSELKESTISLNDIAYFYPSVTKSKFYNKYRNTKISIDGKLNGRIQNIKGIDLDLKFGNQLSFKGDFGIRNISNIDEAFVHLGVDELKSNVTFIADIVPGFNPPKNFYSLGNFNYSGYFDGYINNFSTNGSLNTEIGKASLVVDLNVTEGNENANYKGDIKLEEFDLHKWSGGNPNLGIVSLDLKIRDGRSLVLNNASADLEGTIKLLQFKNYHYQDILINGKITPKNFEGYLSSKDPNVSFDFDGKVAFDKDRNLYNFRSKIENIDLRSLNISKDISIIKGDITFEGSGNSINDIIGDFSGKNLKIVKNDSIYRFDTLAINSNIIDNNGNKKLQLITDKTSFYINGKYDLNTIIYDVQYLIKNNFPYHTRNWKIKGGPASSNQNFDFKINVKDGNEILKLAGVNNFNLENFVASGNINSSIKELNVKSTLPYLYLSGNKFFNIDLILKDRLKNGELLVSIDSSYYSNRKIKKIDMKYTIKGDSVLYNITAPQVIDSIENFDLSGIVIPHPKGYSISVLNNNIKLFGRRWKINNESKISIGNKYIDLENVVITDGNRMIQIEDINSKGIHLSLNDIDIFSFNPLINYEKILFGGKLNSSISISDIFNPNPIINGNISVPSLTLNDDSYGELTVDISKEENEPLNVLLSLSNSANEQAIKLKGEYYLENKTVKANLIARKTPLKFMYYILKKGVSKVDGYINLDASINGPLNDLSINGRGKAYDGAVRVIYLGETYYFDNQNFGITEKRVDLSGAQIKDSEGNVGIISGGLNHKMFKDFHLDASIAGDNVIAVNTTKFDNPIYYGIGRGNVVADFSGSVNTPLMVISAVTTKGTNISIPIKETRNSADKSFITFVDKEDFLSSKKDSVKNQSNVKVEGMTIELNLTMTEDAQVNLIFDELKNDIIRGVGNGNLRIIMSPSGDFNMFGNYTIASGEYLFTAFDFVNKPFIVREGGTIKWTGDPINASLNIEADYAVRTSLSSFISEYLVTPSLQTAAAVSTQVNLKLLLGNTLYNPSVKFDFEFPELTGEMKSYTDSKLRLLKNNDAELNNQVFGLIVFNSFLPTNQLSDVVGNNFIQSAGISTLSEFVSSQLSLFVTGLVNEALEENGLISGVDFDIALRNNTSFQGLTGATSLLPSEIEVRLKNKFRFLDERLSVNIAGNYVRENTLITGLDNYIVPEFFVEYALSKDRQLNLKLYGKYDLDEISVTNRRQKFGIGLRYKNEFGSLVETKAKLSQGMKKIIEEKNYEN